MLGLQIQTYILRVLANIHTNAVKIHKQQKCKLAIKSSSSVIFSLYVLVNLLVLEAEPYIQDFYFAIDLYSE